MLEPEAGLVAMDEAMSSPRDWSRIVQSVLKQRASWNAEARRHETSRT